MDQQSYKATATLSWQFDSTLSKEQCLRYVKEQLAKLVNYPSDADFEDFTVQIDMTQIRTRKRIVHVASFPVDQILNDLEGEDKREYIVDGVSYFVRMSSDRYLVFKRDRVCTSCGLIGTQMILDLNPGDLCPHFNLYAEENGRLVLMTKDHILPKSKGGQNVLENYTTMCAICNNLKSAYCLSNSQVAKLRSIYRNDEKIPKKELRALINKTREEMAVESYIMLDVKE